MLFLFSFLPCNFALNQLLACKLHQVAGTQTHSTAVAGIFAGQERGRRYGGLLRSRSFHIHAHGFPSKESALVMLAIRRSE